MVKIQHRLSYKDLVNQVADCRKCGKGIKIRKAGKQWSCDIGRGERTKRRFVSREKKYRKPFKNLEIYKCEKCGFEYNDFRFFDVNHKDSNHQNNDPKNHELLCPNCHRIETIKLWNKLKI